MKKSITGMLLHELFGLAIICVFILHNILNFKWTKAITTNIIKKNVNSKTKFMYFLNFTLLILILLTGISGIGISTKIFTNISFSNRVLWVVIHNISAYFLLACISIHIGLHLKIIIFSIKKAFKIKDVYGRSKLEKFIAMFFSIIGLITYMSDQKLKEIFNYFSCNDETTKSSSNTTNTAQNSFQSGDKNYTLIAVNTSTSTSLSKLLSSTHCTGCPKNCLLSNPQCSIGRKQAQEVTTEYNSNSSSNSSNYSTSKTDTILNSSNLKSNANSSPTLGKSTEQNLGLAIGSTLLEMGFWISGTYYIVKYNKS